MKKDVNRIEKDSLDMKGKKINNSKGNDMSNNKKKMKQMLILFALFIIFVAASYVIKFEPGMTMGSNFAFFSYDMLILFPPAFILVGLFMVWVDRKTVERFFGSASGFKGFFAAILLACTTLYPFVLVLPMAAALTKKGARLGIVLTYLGASAICRIPMTIFEASFLGLKFTLVRYLVSLPLILVTSLMIEKIVGKDYMEESGLVNSLEM